MPPSVTAPLLFTDRLTLGGGGVSSSISAIWPLPVRAPRTPPSRPLAVRPGLALVEVGMLTVTRSWSASASSLTVRVRVTLVAVTPAAGPVNVTAALALPRSAHATPVGNGLGQASVKSVPGTPPEKRRGTLRLSPEASPRLSVREMLAVSLLSPSMALASGVSRVTELRSLSMMVTSATFGVPGS